MSAIPESAPPRSLAGLKTRAQAARAWMFDAAFPLWADAGFDAATGLFFEKLDADGRPLAAPSRVRVQARQTFVFAEAGRLGWTGPWRARVGAGLATITGRARAPGGAVGHQLDLTGILVDPRRDLYEQAFALLALAQAPVLALASGDEATSVSAAAAARASAQDRATEVLDFLDRDWARPSGGFAEGELKPFPRWQNPHMHLFEAAMALRALDLPVAAGADPGIPRWRAVGAGLAALFERHFFVADAGALREYFNEDWTAAAGDAGAYDEPGHHFEWVWLLDQWARLTGSAHEAEASALYASATRHGICAARGVAIDETWIGGGQKTRTARLWPQTERLKAALVRYEATGALTHVEDACAACDGVFAYFEGMRPGLYRDRMREDGSFVDEPAPASSLYHVVLAFSELLRVAQT